MKTAAIGVLTAALFLSAAGFAQAASITDPVGDFLTSYTGPQDADLDVTSLSVDLNSAANQFLISATFNGVINQSGSDVYVIGVDTGTGAIAPFGPIGNPNVIFNQALVVNQNGSATLGGAALPGSDVAISGNQLSLSIPTSLLPTTGFAAANYGFNIWPRDGLTNNNQIADFAPNNALLSASGISAVSAAPEPSTWMLMILGVGGMGMVLRRRHLNLLPVI